MTQEHEYRISNATSGLDMGIWTAESPEAAWAAMCDAAQADDRTMSNDILIEPLGYIAAVDPNEGVVWGIGRTPREAMDDADASIGYNLSQEEREGALKGIVLRDCSKGLYDHTARDGWHGGVDRYCESGTLPSYIMLADEA